MSLSEAATAFMASPASEADLGPLLGSDETTLMALVTALEGAAQRNHLELLGRSRVTKAVRKAARKAAFRLNCAGVDGERPRSEGISLTVETSLDEIALVSAPGFRAQCWMAFGAIPGAGAVEVICKEGPVLDKLNPLERLSIGKLRRAMRDVKEEGTMALPVLANADLAVRLIDRLQEDLVASGQEIPAGWAHLTHWRAAAVAAGADPTKASAKARIEGPIEAPEDGARALLDIPESGVMMAPTDILSVLFRRIGTLVHGQAEGSEETVPENETAFRARIDDYVADTLASWLAIPGVTERLAHRMETVADVLLAAQGEPRARTALWAARALEDTTTEAPAFIRDSVVNLIDIDGAYTHFEAHQAGGDCPTEDAS